MPPAFMPMPGAQMKAKALSDASTAVAELQPLYCQQIRFAMGPHGPGKSRVEPHISSSYAADSATALSLPGSICAAGCSHLPSSVPTYTWMPQGGTPPVEYCPHEKPWRKLRAKRGFKYFACRHCGAHWRLPQLGKGSPPHIP